MVSKVEGRGLIDPLCLRATVFVLCLLGLSRENMHFKFPDQKEPFQEKK